MLEAMSIISKFRKLAKISPLKALKLESLVRDAISIAAEETTDLVRFALCDLLDSHRIVYQMQLQKSGDKAFKYEYGDECMSYVNTLFRLENRADADIPEVRLELNLRLLLCCLDIGNFDEMIVIFIESLPGLRDCHSSDSSRYAKFKDSARTTLENVQAEILDNVVESIVLYFSGRLRFKGNHDHGRDILLLLLEDIERSWSNLARYRSIDYLLHYSFSECEITDTVHYLKKKLVMTQEKLIPQVDGYDWYEEMQTLLGSLGEVYGRQGKIRNSTRRFNEALRFQKDEGSCSLAMQFNVSMGLIYLSRKGNEKLAIQLFEKALSSAPPEPQPKIAGNCFGGMWNAYYDIREYDKAILCLKEGLKQYPDEEEVEINRCNLLLAHTLSVAAASLPSKQVELRRIKIQEAQHYLDQSFFNRIKDLDTADIAIPSNLIVLILMALFALNSHVTSLHASCFKLARLFFEDEIDDLDDEYHLHCDCCGQRDGASVKLVRCSGCKVKYYCNERHQRMRWRNTFIAHKLVCPFLNRWRKVKKHQENANRKGKDSFESIVNDFIAKMTNHYSSN